MTSKKSFWANCTTNLRRRVWLIAVMTLAMVFALPVLTALLLNAEMMYYNYNNLSIHLGRSFAMHVGMNGGMAFLTAILAVVSAVQGFSYMYQRKKLDLYMSVPVKKSSRFWAIYCNGILVFLVPYLLNVAVSFLVAKAMGATLAFAFVEAVAGIVANTVFYLAVYHVTILAVMLTGNMIVTLLGTGVLLFYDVALSAMLTAYKSTFFITYHYRSDDEMAAYYVSPVARFIVMFGDCLEYDNGYGSVRHILWGEYIKGLFPIIIIGVITLLIAYWCYGKKPSEVCGKAMAFARTKAPIKILIIVITGLTGGLMFYGLAGSSKPFFIFGIVAGILLSQGVTEVIYEFDIRSIKNGWKSLLWACGIITVWYCVFAFDLIGYDDYVPETEEVESLAFYFGDGSYDSFFDENLRSVNYTDYTMEHMEIREVAPVLQLAQQCMGENLPSEDADEEAMAAYRSCFVKYRLKNGKEVYRTFPVPYEAHLELLDQIVTDEAYQRGCNVVYNEPLFALGDKLELRYDTGAEQKKVTEFTLKELQSAYREDLKEFTFTDSTVEKVQGVFRMERVVNGEFIYGNLPVYPSFENVNALLDKAGMKKDYHVDAAEVLCLTVVNSNSKARDMYMGDGYQNHTLSGDFDVELTTEDPEEIGQILEGVYPDVFMEYWKPAGMINTDYYVTVTFRNSPENDRFLGYYMVEDKIPEFVKEKTKYTEEKRG